MRTLGIDWGEARIGLAISDPTGIIATPRSTLHEKDKGAQINRVIELVASEGIERIVVGLPLEMDGTAGPMAQMAEKYAQKLERLTGLEVFRWDERLTSVAAERALSAMGRKRKRKGDIDTIAATILLQSFLDATPMVS